MSSGQKVAFSFLTALFLFAGFVFFAQTSLMSQIETRFYAQSKIGEKSEQLEKVSESCNNYISNILTKIQTDDKAYLKSSAVKTYAHQTPSEKDATERKNLTAQLFDDLEAYGFDGMRLIEKNGRTLHYSSYEQDVLKRVSLNTTYKLYTDVCKDSDELSSDIILVDSEKPATKYFIDKKTNRIVISFPFYITDNTYFATLVCYFDIHNFEQKLVDDGIIKYSENLSAITDDSLSNAGFVLGLPKSAQDEFVNPVINIWKKNQNNKNTELERILEKQDGTYWLLMTASDAKYLNVSAVYSSTLFQLPKELELLIYICVFTTLILITSLLFNLKRDYLTVIKTRIKKVQFGIINEYFENKEKIEWSVIARQLENRKAELSEEIKKTIGGKSKKYSKQVDAYLDSSWADIIGILKAQNDNASGNLSGASLEEIRKVIEEVLQTAQLNVNVTAPVKTKPVPVVQEVAEADSVEEIEEIEDIEDADAVEEIEEIEDADSVEEIEEIEDADAVEEIGDADEVEEIEEIEEISDADAVEEIEEISDADAVEEIEEISEADIVEDVEEAAEIALQEPQITNEIEEIAEAEDVEEVEDFEDVDAVEELEEIDELPAVIIEPPPVPFFVSNDDPVLHEDLTIGHFEQPEEPTFDKNFEFVVIKPNFINNKQAEVQETVEAVESVEKVETSEPEEAVESVEAAEPEEIEEIDEAEMIPDLPFFSMTQFAQNNAQVIELTEHGELSENKNDSIVENDGVFQIASNLSYNQISQNKEFKNLVDSVLQN